LTADEAKMEAEDTRIVICAECGAKNRIPLDKINLEPKCGKCHAPLKEQPKKDAGSITLRCTECWAKNKAPLDRLDDNANCGKCGTHLKTQGVMGKNTFVVTDANFEENILKSPLPALMFAWAPWCPTCRTYLPIVESFAGDSEGKVRVAKINVDTSPNIASRFSIMSVPQIFIFDRGELKEELPGALQKHEIMMKMTHYLL
jgi:thioredoxin 2